MKKTVISVFSLLLIFLLTYAGSTSRTCSAFQKADAPRTDIEIGRCITDRLARSKKLNPQGFKVTVSDGAATLTGKAVNAGSKGAATRIARSCGASTVNNNIEAPPIPRPKKKTESRPVSTRNAG